MNTVNIIGGVVHRDLCSGCGLCAGVCPSRALSMGFAGNGDLVPQATGTCSGQCGICTDICPFSSGVHDPRRYNVDNYGSEHGRGDRLAIHQDTGYYLQALAGYSEAHRPISASGGLTTLCLERLLSAHLIDKAAVVETSVSHAGFAFRYRAAASIGDLRACSGSIYHQVSIAELIRVMMNEPDVRWAVVGVPCLCAALRKACRRLPRLEKAIRYVLGLACGMYQNTYYTELLIARSGLRREQVQSVNYRQKSSLGPANNYQFQVTDRQGSTARAIPYLGLPFYLGDAGYFRINACNFCKDVFAETADACFMDAWLPQYRNEPRGTSLVLVRNQVLRDLLLVQDQDGTCLEEIPIDRLVASQAGHVRRKRHLIHMRLGAGGASHNRNSAIEWWLQRQTQKRSKRAWSLFGSRWRMIPFWACMADLVIVRSAYLRGTRMRSKVMKLLKCLFDRKPNLRGSLS